MRLRAGASPPAAAEAETAVCSPAAEAAGNLYARTAAGSARAMSAGPTAAKTSAARH